MPGLPAETRSPCLPGEDKKEQGFFLGGGGISHTCVLQKECSGKKGLFCTFESGHLSDFIRSFKVRGLSVGCQDSILACVILDQPLHCHGDWAE